MAEVAAAERPGPRRPLTRSDRSSSSPRPAGSIPPAPPCGKQTLWGYCHVPNGSTVDMTEAIEGQIERFAPGFRDQIVARSTMPPTAHPGCITPIIWAAISTVAPKTCVNSLPGRAVRYDPYATPESATLPLLGLNPTRRWRPWHVRLPRS